MKRLVLLTLAITAVVVLTTADVQAQLVASSGKPELTREERRAHFRARLEKRRAGRLAQRADVQKVREARQYRRTRLDGQHVSRNVARLTSEIRWHKSLRTAQSVARQQKKPVVWIQALGELDGFL